MSASEPRITAAGSSISNGWMDGWVGGVTFAVLEVAGYSM